MDLQDKISTLNTWANEARIHVIEAEDAIDWRTITAYHFTKFSPISYIADANRDAIAYLVESLQWFIYGYTYDSRFVYWYDVHQGLYEQESAITWKAICEAWAKDDFEGRKVTIAFIDRMRELIWNEPFHVAWAARPEQEF